MFSCCYVVACMLAQDLLSLTPGHAQMLEFGKEAMYDKGKVLKSARHAQRGAACGAGTFAHISCKAQW